MNYRNAKFVTADGVIDCEISHPVYGWIPYTLNPSDADTTINNDDLLREMEKNKDVSPYSPPTQEEIDEMVAAHVRNERNLKLAVHVDPIAGNALRWSDLTSDQQQALRDYRQKLLDVPQQAGFPHNVTWPSKPE